MTAMFLCYTRLLDMCDISNMTKAPSMVNDLMKKFNNVTGGTFPNWSLLTVTKACPVYDCTLSHWLTFLAIVTGTDWSRPQTFISAQ